LEQLLREPRPELGFARLADLGVLTQLHPELFIDEWVQERFNQLRKVLKDPAWMIEVTDYMIEFTHFGLLTIGMDLDALEAFERRLKVRRTTVENIRLLHELEEKFCRLVCSPSPSAAYQILKAYPKPVLLIAYVATGEQIVRDHILNYRDHWSRVKIRTTGNQLKEIGLPPGPRYRDLLNQLLYARLDGLVRSDEEEQAYLQRLLAETGVS
jgi:tRNA nucleotidyltransferase (CCA-adding enzyme)